MTARFPVSVLVISFLLSVASSATVAAGSRGPRVGEKAPAFELGDQYGQVRSLVQLLRDGPVALVFFRSAKW